MCMCRCDWFDLFLSMDGMAAGLRHDAPPTAALGGKKNQLNIRSGAPHWGSANNGFGWIEKRFNQIWRRLRSHEESEATTTLDMHEIRSVCYNTMLIKLNIPQTVVALKVHCP